VADRTGLGEAVIGAAFVGGTTSLSGIVTSVAAAAEGHAELAISNAVGGIAAQTAFLVVADIAYRRANLEHAAASITNITQGALLIALLSLSWLAMTVPGFAVLHVHPVTILILLGYGFGLRLLAVSHKQPMWRPQATSETRPDLPDEESLRGPSTGALILRFAALGAAVGLAGYVVAGSGIVIARDSGLSQTVVGALFTAIVTSLPELVTTVAAVRRGALTLAVGGIIGGNSFDVLLVAFSDFAYRPGSIFLAVGQRQGMLVALSVLMTAVLLLGLLRREKHGIANIGFESLLVLVIYLTGVGLQLYLG
ncbi:MAG TPA: sodium:calcium antiporter, partial [Kiloniellales bacterium]|nr:sodium:calcium antiporter [Kiloniellales bacterium]